MARPKRHSTLEQTTITISPKYLETLKNEIIGSSIGEKIEFLIDQHNKLKNQTIEQEWNILKEQIETDRETMAKNIIRYMKITAQLDAKSKLEKKLAKIPNKEKMIEIFKNDIQPIIISNKKSEEEIKLIWIERFDGRLNDFDNIEQYISLIEEIELEKGEK